MNKDKIIKQIKRLLYASDAFQQAETLLKHMQEQGLKVNDDLYNPMMCGVITTYGMNFNKANGLGPLPKAYEKFENVKLAESHEKMINARNQLYAHRDIENTINDRENAYKIDVWLENGMLLMRPTMIDISHDRIQDILFLIACQRQKLQEDLDSKLMQVVDKSKEYRENEVWELGRDFP